MATATKEEQIILKLNESEAQYLYDIMGYGGDTEFKKEDLPSYKEHLDTSIWTALDDVL